MPVLNIEDQEAFALAAELAKLSGQTMEQAVKEALKEKLAEAKSAEASRNQVLARVMELAHEIASAPTLDSRSADEIIGYDEFGVPS